MGPTHKKNYSAWKIKIENFPQKKNLEEQIKFLINFAILAPSGHNSQPWDFKLTANTLSILKNKSRFLTASDILGRQCFISIGCLIENLLLVANYYGVACDTKFFAEPSDPDLIATIVFSSNGKIPNDPLHLANFINKRLTNRFEYSSQQPRPELLEKICKIAKPHFSIIALTNGQKNSLSEIMVRAQVEVMDNPEFRKELSRFIKPNTTESYFGMPGFTLGMPLPISYIASNLIKKFNLSKISKKQDTELLTKHTPVILIINSEKDGRNDWLETGRIMENLWLTCTKQNLCCSPMAGAIQIPRYRKAVQKILNTDLYPQAILRSGYSNHQVGHSPRFNF